MIKKMIKLSSMTFLMFSCAVAAEFRAPLVTERGSLRYDMEHKKEKWSLDIFSAGYSRSIDRAFISHGFKKKELSTLFFNSDNFKLSDALRGNDPASVAQTDVATEDFNMNLGSTKLFPRVSYEENGFSLGGRFEYPVFEGKGRVGVRAQMPFKRIRVERDNQAEVAAAGDQENVIIGDFRNDVQIPLDRTDAGGANIAPAANAREVVREITVRNNAYRLSAVRNLPINVGGDRVPFVRQDGANNVFVGATQYAGNNNPANLGGVVENGAVPYALFYQEASGRAPDFASRPVRMPNPLANHFVGANAAATPVSIDLGGGVPVNLAGLVLAAGGAAETDAAHFQVAAAAVQAQVDPVPVAALQSLPAGALADGTLYDFVAADPNAEAVMNRDADNLWLISVAGPDGNIADPATDALLQAGIARYGSVTVEQWLWENNYKFQTTERVGVGDLDLGLFYEHTFNRDWRGLLEVGLRAPTGGRNRTAYNPYNLPFGNGNHVELKAYGEIGWRALHWMNLKADIQYAYAFKASEQICATFKGATIKGVGPRMDADIDYSYLRGHLEATMYHPKHRELATTIGYELEYKDENKTNFKASNFIYKPLAEDANSWFGGEWGTLNGVTGWQRHRYLLDPSVANRNTEQFKHRFRIETSWQALKQFNIFAGTAYTFAGKGAGDDSDLYVGTNVKF